MNASQRMRVKVPSLDARAWKLKAWPQAWPLSREIVVTCGWPILGGTRHFNLDEYDGIEVEPQLFSVLALRKDASVFKRRFFIANNLRSHAEARWVASEVERAARRTRKNHRSA